MKKTILLALPFLLFGDRYMLISLIGVMFFSMTMSVTLAVLVSVLPDAPGLAFGLTASALWPGMIAGQLMTLTGPALWLCVLFSFGFGLWAMLYAERKIET